MINLETYLKIISTHGLAILISIIAIFSVLKNFKNQEANQKELIKTLVKLDEKLSNDLPSADTLKLIARLRARYVLKDYSYSIAIVLIKNNISQNIDDIKNEMITFITVSTSKTIELLKTKGNKDQINEIASIIQDNLQIANDSVFELLTEIAKKENYKKDIFIRKMENHIQRIENKIIEDIENMEL